MNRKVRIYAASGWFSDNQRTILDSMEDLLRSHNAVQSYLPRVDGVKLSPDEFHSHELREKIFLENVDNISRSDYILANLDGADGFYDTGTLWEVGYAMSKHIPVLAFDSTGKIQERFSAIVKGFYRVFSTLEEIKEFLDTLDNESRVPNKVLFIGPDDTPAQITNNEDILALLLESHGSNFRWLDNLKAPEIYESLDDIFKDVDYVISVIDDRHPIVSWMMGQAYQRNIPVISYTNYDYGVNIMLLVSILRHVKGKDELRDTIQKLKREGILAIPEYDSTDVKAM